MKDNYIDKLLSISVDEVPIKLNQIPFSRLSTLLPAKSVSEYKLALEYVLFNFDYKVSDWPAFGVYEEQWMSVFVSKLKHELDYCERGSRTSVARCRNNIDLTYQVLKKMRIYVSLPTSQVAAQLDHIADQRLILWLSKSTEIYRMFICNTLFGMRVLEENVAWMCDELVRMRVFENQTDAFDSEFHILHGLMLSGLPRAEAEKMYAELRG